MRKLPVSTETNVRDALHEVLDPELGINVVDLGMVGPITVKEDSVVVNMRLTSMSCPFWELFVEQVKAAVGAVDGIREVQVMFDRSEPWSPGLMTNEARQELERVGLMPPTYQRSQPQPERGELLQIATGVLGSPFRSSDALTN